MIPRLELSHHTELHDGVSCDDTGCRLVGASSLIRAGESNTSLFDWQTND